MKYKLLCVDCDGVLVDTKNSWIDTHKVLGTWDPHGKELTQKWLNGEAELDELCERVINGLWKGKDATAYLKYCREAPRIQGAQALFSWAKQEGIVTAIVSAASVHLLLALQKQHDIDHIFGNHMHIEDNKISGKWHWELGAGFEHKTNIIETLCDTYDIKFSEVIFVGDSSNDIHAMKHTGLAIAFNTSDENVRQEAQHIIEEANLGNVVELLETLSKH